MFVTTENIMKRPVLKHIIFYVIKSRRMRWAGHVARAREEEMCMQLWWGNLREGDHLEDPSVDGDNIKILLRLTE
jgi:hypothetical protein